MSNNHIKPETEFALLDRQMEELLRRRMELWGKPESLPNAQRVMLSALRQIDRCQAFSSGDSRLWAENNPVQRLEKLPEGASAGCQGVEGAYSHLACEAMLEQPRISFYQSFEDVFEAVDKREVEYGILPVENSTAGPVTQVLELISKYRLYICKSIKLKVEHCLCASPGRDPAGIKRVISHPQALSQCAGFIKSRGYIPERFSNTAAAAKQVAQSAEPLACICSSRGAELHGLRILERGIQDHAENFTRFLCVSRGNILLPGADTVSITLAFPNEPGYLNRLLTRFAVCNLDLSRIQSMPLAGGDFNVIFHLDFRGSILDRPVAGLLGSMQEEFDCFAFLGNYEVIR